MICSDSCCLILDIGTLCLVSFLLVLLKFSYFIDLFKEMDSFFLIYFFIWVHWILVVALGIQFPAQGSNLGPVHLELGILATRPPGKSQKWILISFIFLCCFSFSNCIQFLLPIILFFLCTLGLFCSLLVSWGGNLDRFKYFPLF